MSVQKRLLQSRVTPNTRVAYLRMERIRLARNAMATRFEFVLAGDNTAQLRGAGEEALDEIDRIESRLSLYRSGSEISQINERAGFGPVRVSPEVFTLLVRAGHYFEISGGTFDPTIAPLVRCWGFMKGSGSRPSDDDIAAARSLVGMNGVKLDPTEYSVQFAQPGMMIDLGSIGKGYALDCAAEILRDAGVEHALLHGGTSTIAAVGRDADGAPWKVAIDHPGPRHEGDQPLAIVELVDQSLSVSAVWGKFFEIDGKLLGHVIDPRTGWPGQNAVLGAVILDTATATDALSTAVLLGSSEELELLAQTVPGLRYLQMKGATETGFTTLAHAFPSV